MRRSLKPAQLYALVGLGWWGVPVAALLLLGAPGLSLPSGWSTARANIDDGTYPSGVVVDLVSTVLLLGWGACVWLLVSSLRARATADDGVEPGGAMESDSGFGSDLDRGPASASRPANRPARPPTTVTTSSRWLPRTLSCKTRRPTGRGSTTRCPTPRSSAIPRARRRTSIQ